MERELTGSEHEVIGALLAECVIRRRSEFNNENFECHFRATSVAGSVRFYGKVLKDTYFPCISSVVNAGSMIYVTFEVGDAVNYMIITKVVIEEYPY